MNEIIKKIIAFIFAVLLGFILMNMFIRLGYAEPKVDGDGYGYETYQTTVIGNQTVLIRNVTKYLSYTITRTEVEYPSFKRGYWCSYSLNTLNYLVFKGMFESKRVEWFIAEIPNKEEIEETASYTREKITKKMDWLKVCERCLDDIKYLNRMTGYKVKLFIKLNSPEEGYSMPYRNNWTAWFMFFNKMYMNYSEELGGVIISDLNYINKKSGVDNWKYYKNSELYEVLRDIRNPNLKVFISLRDDDYNRIKEIVEYFGNKIDGIFYFMPDNYDRAKEGDKIIVEIRDNLISEIYAVVPKGLDTNTLVLDVAYGYIESKGLFFEDGFQGDFYLPRMIDSNEWIKIIFAILKKPRPPEPIERLGFYGFIALCFGIGAYLIYRYGGLIFTKKKKHELLKQLEEFYKEDRKAEGFE